LFAVFVVLEYMLSLDGIYSNLLALTTASLAVLLFWRLHVAGYMSSDNCLLLSSLHLTKLSLLLPSYPYSSPSSPLTTCVALFLLSFLFLRLSLYLPSSPVSPGQLLIFCGTLVSGLLLGVDSLLSPLWLSFTHQPPSSASLIATIAAVTAVYMNHGLDHIRSSETGRLTYCPPGLLFVSLLLLFLQPQFDLSQMVEAVAIALTGSEDIPSEMTLVAWGQLLSWAVLGAAVLVVVAMVTNVLVPVATTVLGGAIGAMATRMLGSPFSLACGHAPSLPGGSAVRDDRRSHWVSPRTSLCHAHHPTGAEISWPHPVFRFGDNDRSWLY
jgi:hypothetical protein